jgi:hypothetical protein
MKRSNIRIEGVTAVRVDVYLVVYCFNISIHVDLQTRVVCIDLSTETKEGREGLLPI